MSDNTGEQAGHEQTEGGPGAGPPSADSGSDVPAGRFWLIPAVITLAAVLVVVVIIGMRRAEAQRAEEERKAAERAKASIPTVKVGKVARVKLMLDRAELSGTLRASRDVMVFPEVPGKLERVAVKRGREVRAGEVLAVVESDTLRAQLEQVNAALAVAMSGARVARVGRDNAASGRERVRGLEKTGSASEREVEGAETMLQTAEAQVALAESQIEQARAAVRLTKLQLEKAVITAPFAGTVADDFNHTAGAMVGPGLPVARIVEMQHLRIDLRASERDLARIRNGQKADVRVASSPGRVFEGIVLVAGPVVDPMTRTAPVEIAVENVVEEGEHLLKPGMYADVSITVGVRTNVLAVPTEAVTTSGDRDVVLAVRFHETQQTGAAAGGGGLVYSLDSGAIGKGLKSGVLLEIRPGSVRGEVVITSEGGGEVLLVASSHRVEKPGGPEEAEGVKGVEDAEVVEEQVATEDIYIVVALPVEKGLRSGDRVEIISGVEEGELIVTAGARVLAPGSKVRVEPAGVPGEEEPR